MHVKLGHKAKLASIRQLFSAISYLTHLVKRFTICIRTQSSLSRLETGESGESSATDILSVRHHIA